MHLQPNEMRALLLINILVVWLSCGMNWVIQLMQYPLFALVGTANFTAYHSAHSNIFGLVGVPLITIATITSVLLVIWPPPNVPRWVMVGGVVCILTVWGVTLFTQIPDHGMLARGFDAAVLQRLVANNWGRTLAWTTHTALLLGVLWSQLRYSAALEVAETPQA